MIETVCHIPPAKALEGISTADAERHVEQVAHSVAEIVAHMAFWQEWFCQRCEGTAAPIVGRAGLGWPAVASGSWPAIRDGFLAGLDRAAALGAADPGRPVTPAIEFPPLAQYSVRDALVHVAQHNAHHLGQIIVIRQLLGQWPPPAGSWTW